MVRDVGDKLEVQSSLEVVLHDAEIAVVKVKQITLASLLSNYECIGLLDDCDAWR